MSETSFSNIFINYGTSIAALREFFAHVDPVASEADVDAQERRMKAVTDVLSEFSELADESDKADMRQILEASVAEMEKDSERVELDLKGHFASHALHHAMRRMRSVAPHESHHDLLNRSILTGLVGYFEVLVADLAHAFYRNAPEAASNEDKVLSVNDLRSFDSIPDAMNFLVSKRVDDLLRGSIDDWNDFFRTRLKVSLQELVPEWPQWCEMFQRRHVIVHAGGTATRRYLENVDWENVSVPEKRPAENSDLVIESSYLERALALFEVAGLLLCQEVWRKLNPDEGKQRHDETDGLINAAYRRLLSNDWYVAEHLAAWGEADEAASEGHRLIHKFNRLLCIKRQNRPDEIDSELEAFDGSAIQPKFAIALASLRDRPDDFFKQLPIAMAAGVSEKELREWPILEEVRSDERFEAALRKSGAAAEDDGADSDSARGSQENSNTTA